MSLWDRSRSVSLWLGRAQSKKPWIHQLLVLQGAIAKSTNKTFASWTSHSANSCAPLWVAPGGLDWSAPWHDILHKWNARVLECAQQAGVKLWSRRCLEPHWKLANNIANLSDNRWLKRALEWTARPRTRIGRPTNTWDAQIQMYCRWKNLGKWWATAMQTANRSLAGTYGLLYRISGAEVVRVEIKLNFVVLLRPKALPSGKQVRFDSTVMMINMMIWCDNDMMVWCCWWRWWSWRWW